MKDGEWVASNSVRNDKNSELGGRTGSLASLSRSPMGEQATPNDVTGANVHRDDPSVDEQTEFCAYRLGPQTPAILPAPFRRRWMDDTS